MNKVLIDGCAGFIGSWIVKELVSQGHEVLGVDDLSGGSVDNLEEVSGSKNFIFQQVGCEDEKRISYLFEGFRPEIVYHLAANAREGASFFQPLSIVKRNTLAYTNILMNSIKYKVKRIILFSSIAAYGNQEPPFYEGMPLKPVDLYGLQKANMEEMTKLMAKCHGFEYIIFRPYNVYGPYQSLSDKFRNVIGIWMNSIMKGDPLVIYGDGSQERAFSYIEDNLPCYIRAMDCEPDQIFNIGSSTSVNLLQAAVVVCQVMDVEFAKYPVIHLPDRYNEVQAPYCDTKKVREVLGFEQNHSLLEGLKKMAAWAKEEGPQEWLEGDPIELTSSDKLPKNWRK